MNCLEIEKDGLLISVTPQTFKHHKFAGAKVISGDKYYIDKAVSLGAIKPKAKPKKKK